MNSHVITPGSAAVFVLFLLNYNVANAQIVTPVLDARDDNAQTNEDTSVTVNVTANDVFILISPSVTSVTHPMHGQAVKIGNNVKYTPYQNYFGSDSFRYTVSDGILSDTATVFVTVNPVNDPPIAANDSAITDEDKPTIIGVLGNDYDVDNDSLTIVSVTQPSNGVATIVASGIYYEPSHNFNGNDSFTYTISDGNGGQATATVSITINPVVDLAITKTQSGLVAIDPLNNETKSRAELEANQGFWHYGGSAFSYFNPPAPTDLYKDSQGLHLAVSPPSNGTYAGYYAVTGPANAKLFHSVITTPTRTISGDFFQNGLYVQTWDGRINYVTCVSITSTAGTSWHVIRTFGDINQATSFEVLWSDPTSNQPLTRDCTIITNGNNYLKVYMDQNKVYENNNIDLQMPGPFLYFLEPQNSHAQSLYGVYKDFYMTKDETVKLTNAPSTASRVDIIDTTGGVLASAPISNGNATLDVGMYHFPLAANIKIYDANNMEIVSSNTSIYGGDQYAVAQQ